MAKRRKKKSPTMEELVFQLAVVGIVFFFMSGGKLSDIFFWAGLGGVLAALCYLVYRVIKPRTLRRRQGRNVHRKAEPFLPPDNATQCRAQGGCEQSQSEIWTLELIQALEWSHFEKLCVAYYRAAGYKASWKRLGPDNGIDISLSRLQNDGEEYRAVVQCKAWSNRPVGVRYIRELLGSMASVGVGEGVFITTTNYTTDAQRFAQANNIQLLTGSDLLQMIKALPESEQLRLKTWITSGDYRTPRCPNCGSMLCKRMAKRGQNPGQSFWACPTFPKCRYTLPMSRAEKLAHHSRRELSTRELYSR